MAERQKIRLKQELLKAIDEKRKKLANVEQDGTSEDDDTSSSMDKKDKAQDLW